MSLFAPHPLLDMTSADVPANAHETLGFELGWDHARCGVMPSLAQSFEASSLRSGWAVGHTTNSSRPRVAPRSVQLWLHLRLQAWVLGQRVEPVQVTPRYLEQLEVSHCPITRMPLDASSLLNHEGVFARVRHDAAYVAGNIAVLGARAERARQGLGRERAAELGKSLGSGSSSGLGGLTAPQWKRMTALGSFVEPLTHAQACEQPLLVLPPNRLRLLNAAQALQAFASRQLLAPGWSLCVSRVEALLLAKAAQRSFQTFFFMPCCHGFWRRAQTRPSRAALGHRRRLAIAPGTAALAGFRAHPGAGRCESLVVRAHAKRQGQGALLALGEHAAVDGWGLARQGQLGGDDVMRCVPARRNEPCSLAQDWTPRRAAQQDLRLTPTA